MKSEGETETTPAGRRFRLRARWGVGALIFLAIAAGVVFVARRSPAPSSAGRAVPTVESLGAASPGPSAAASPGALPDLTISPEQAARAGLRFEAVQWRTLSDSLRTTGTIQPNAYRETRITPLSGGRVTSVLAKLGDSVKPGQVLATIFSSELAEVQMKYLMVDANLQFHIAQDQRFDKLAEIGAVSRQEEEEVHARLREHHAEHAALRERMKLYGLTEAEIQKLRSASDVRSDVPVHAPSAGVVTMRAVNPGQVVSMSDALFAVTDLSNVWAIANVYEKDFASLRPGAGVTITAPAFPRQSFRGTIAYVDPRVDPQTRTAQVRIEIPNSGQTLKLGMFVDVGLDQGGVRRALAVPKAALQSIGEERVAFVQVGPGAFQIRRLQLAEEAADWVHVLAGLREGEQVVTEGSFFLRAEMGRLGK